MVSDSETGFIFLGLREFGDEVESNNLKWVCLWLREYWCQRSLSGSGIDLMALTFCAPPDILYHILSELRPPVSPLDQICSPTDSWVAMYGYVVVIMNELFHLRRLSGYAHPPILLPYTVNFLQLVTVNLRVNHTFILFLSALWFCQSCEEGVR